MAATGDGLCEALRLHRAGATVQAGEAYRAILAENPEQADALHLLGLLASEEGRHGEATRLIREAANLRPAAAVYWSNLGLALSRQGEHQEAVGAYRRAIELDPSNARSLAKLGRALERAGQAPEAAEVLLEAARRDGENPDTWNAYGAALAALGQWEPAAAAFRRAARLDGTFGEAYLNLGHALRLQGILAEAAAAYRCAWQLEPANPAARAALVETLRESGDRAFLERQPEQAVRAYRQLAELEPEDADVHFRLGLSLTAGKQLPSARAHYQESLRLRPGHAETLNNLAHVALALGDADRAVELLLRALEARPGYVDALYNLGVTLQELDRHPEAGEIYRQLVAAHPDHADGWNNLGGVCLTERRLDEAMEHYRRALAAQPGHVDARWNLGLARLTVGEFAAGWEGYEARLEQSTFPRRAFGQPRWEGEPIEGRTLLVWAEQGLGDTLQFSRYLPLLRERRCRLVFECQPRLAPLFEGWSDWLRVKAKGEPLGEFDVHVPLLSLPRLLGTTVDAIPAPAGTWAIPGERLEKWRRALAGHAGFRVGLVWGGNPHNYRGRQRSLPLELLAGLGEIPGVRLLALQKGPQAEEMARANGAGVIAIEPADGDILDAAALASQMDLVITVDTMMAHLAGSLGKPVWTLLPLPADWRWLLEREDSPWYPGMRLLRQPAPGDWAVVVDRARRELTRLIRGSRTPGADCPPGTTTPADGSCRGRAIAVARTDRRGPD